MSSNPQMQLNDIAIVILNWNGEKLLEQFLPSVIKYSKGAHIYLADNASTDGSLKVVKEKFPEVSIIENKSNGGFAKGYNDALKSVHEKLYLLLNSDVKVTENWLQPLLGTINENGIAGVQPKIKSFHSPNTFEHAGASGGMIDKDFYPFCRGRIFSKLEKDKNQYDYPMNVFWASGACMLIRKELYWEVGGLDEDFFAHMEEIDLCWRIQKRGYQFKVAPSSVVYHVGGGTLDYQSPRKTYLNFRNSLYMILKNYEGWLSGKIFRRMCLDGLSGVLFILQGKPKLTIAIIKAHFSFYTDLGKMYRKREKGDWVSFKDIKGVYRGSILWSYFVHGIHEFSKLNKRRIN